MNALPLCHLGVAKAMTDVGFHWKIKLEITYRIDLELLDIFWPKLGKIKSDIHMNEFLFVCLLGVYRPTQEFFTHIKTPPLPVKGCKF